MPFADSSSLSLAAEPAAAALLTLFSFYMRKAQYVFVFGDTLYI